MKKIIPIIFAALMVASILIFFVAKSKTKSNDVGTIPAPSGEEVVFTLESSPYSQKITTVSNNGEIYLPTDKAGLYYTANLNNEINFYTYSNGSFSPASYEKKTASVSISASSRLIPVNITYIDADGLFVGYGVFTSDMNPNVEVYSYAFVKIAKNPAGYGDGYMLLADFDKDNFYKADKVFSEMYLNYNPESTSSVTTSLSQNTRLIDKDGCYKQTWSMMTDEFMANEGADKLFISSRYYNSDEASYRSDIMVYSSALRPSIVAKDIRGNWFVSDSNGYHYIVETDGGFKVVVQKDGIVTDKIVFEGEWTDYLRSGNYIVNKNTNVLTNLLTGEQKTLTGIAIKSATVFSINSSGTKMVFASPMQDLGNGTPTQVITYVSADEPENAVRFVEPLLWEESGSFIWLNDSEVMSVRALNDSGTEVGNVIYKF